MKTEIELTITFEHGHDLEKQELSAILEKFEDVLADYACAKVFISNGYIKRIKTEEINLDELP